MCIPHSGTPTLGQDKVWQDKGEWLFSEEAVCSPLQMLLGQQVRAYVRNDRDATPIHVTRDPLIMQVCAQIYAALEHACKHISSFLRSWLDIMQMWTALMLMGIHHFTTCAWMKRIKQLHQTASQSWSAAWALSTHDIVSITLYFN